MEYKGFTIICDKCGSKNVFVGGTHDTNALIDCKDCENKYDGDVE